MKARGNIGEIVEICCNALLYTETYCAIFRQKLVSGTDMQKILCGQKKTLRRTLPTQQHLQPTYYLDVRESKQLI